MWNNARRINQQRAWEQSWSCGDTSHSQLQAVLTPWTHCGLCLSVRMTCLHWEIKTLSWITLKLWTRSFFICCEFGAVSERKLSRGFWLFSRSQNVCADIIDHYTESNSPRTNHPLPVEKQMESAFNCFLFSLLLSGSGLVGAEAGGLQAGGLHD